MEIVALYEKDHKSLVAFGTSVMSLAELLAKSDINRRFYITIRQTNPLGEFTDHDLDLSNILLETKLGKSSNWDDFLTKVTPAMLDSYATVIPDISGPSSETKRPVVVNVANYDNIAMSYTSLLSPDIQNVFQRRWNLPDLALTKFGDDAINFQNCLCSVNGVMSYPVLFEDKLFLRDGAKNLWSLNDHRGPDVVLLDTTPLGGHQLVRFSECSKIFKNAEKTPRADCDIEIVLPDGIDLSRKTVLMVVAHRLYFHDNVKVVSNKSVVISPPIMSLHTSLLLLKEAQNEFNRNTDVLETGSVSDYITTTMWSDDHYGAYFVIIDNPAVIINREPCDNDIENHTLNCKDPFGGILVRSLSGQLASYVATDYKSNSLLYVAPGANLYRMDTKRDATQLGVATFDCVHQDMFINYHDTTFEMVYLLS